MKNVILVDFNKEGDWEFAKKINEYAPFEVKGIQTNKKFHHTKIGTIVRYLIYFFYPLFFVLFKRRHYDKVIAWQQFYGINFAFWSRMLHMRKRNYLAIDTFIYKPRGGNLVNSIISISNGQLTTNMWIRLYAILLPNPNIMQKSWTCRLASSVLSR